MTDKQILDTEGISFPEQLSIIPVNILPVFNAQNRHDIYKEIDSAGNFCSSPKQLDLSKQYEITGNFVQAYFYDVSSLLAEDKIFAGDQYFYFFFSDRIMKKITGGNN